MSNLNERKSFRRLILWRARHLHRSLQLEAYARIKDENPSFTESLLSPELSESGLYKPHSEKVPRGFVPLYVGSQERRFVIPMVYLSMPYFRELMESTAEEFGFEQEGGLKIACEEDAFEEILIKCVADHKAKTKTRRK